MSIAIVTDTTADWYLEDYESRGVTVVPLKVCFGEETFLDQLQISSEEFYQNMQAAENLPTTSQPSPGDFAQVFQRLKDEGYSAVICLHIATPLSGTAQSALIAAQNAPLPVRVLETTGTTAHLGLLLDAACALRHEGCTLDQMAERLLAYQERIGILLCPESLDNLVRGGRFPKDAADQAGLLNIRMVLTLDGEGRVALCDKTKGAKGQLARCISFVKEHIQRHGPCNVRITHTQAQKSVDALKKALEEMGAECRLVSVDYCGATIATHLGMGAYCVAVAPCQVA